MPPVVIDSCMVWRRGDYGPHAAIHSGGQLGCIGLEHVRLTTREIRKFPHRDTASPESPVKQRKRIDHSASAIAFSHVLCELQARNRHWIGVGCVADNAGEEKQQKPADWSPRRYLLNCPPY